jgi:hypothetical protein
MWIDDLTIDDLQDIVENTHAVPKRGVLELHLEYGFCHRCEENARRRIAGEPYHHDQWWLSAQELRRKVTAKFRTPPA